MRVVLLNQYYAPAEAATAQFVADLAQRLASEGHRVCVVCSRRSYPDPSRLYPETEILDGVCVRRTWGTGFGRNGRLGRMIDYLSFMAGASRVLAVHRDSDLLVSLTSPPLVATLGLAAARLQGIPLLCWVMDIYPELAFELGVLSRRSPAGRLLSGLAGFTLRRANGVIALGETMAARLRAAGVPRVSVVHNWADGEAIRPRPAADHALRHAWGWKDRFVVLYSGNLGLVHDFDTVLGAAERLRDERRVLFAFVGDGPRRAYVKREVARRGLRNVEFRPHVARDDLGQSLTAGDVHLVTLREGLEGLVVPSKIYGILAAGRPTLYVGPHAGEVDAIMREGGCGLRVAVGDSAALAAGIKGYLHDEKRRGEDGRRARDLFDRRFTKERALEAHLRVLESTLAGPV
jgi:glycosyltransferase involved in cell wall biosynthesis